MHVGMPQAEIVVILQKFIGAVIFLSLEPRKLPLARHAIAAFNFNQIALLVL
jgi:hypothetical protein